MNKNYDDIGIRFINDKETLSFFNELNSTVQSKIILNALRQSGKVIAQQIKTNFLMQKKDKSKTNYRDLSKTLKIANRKKKENQLGVIIGITKEGYKYRWIQWGTEERYTKKKKIYRGQIVGNNFFFSAVEQKINIVKDSISDEIIKSMENVVKKYDK